MKPYEAISSLVKYQDGRLVCLRTGRYRDTTVQTSGYAACKGSINGEIYRDLAHRVVWFMHNGPIPDGMEIDHLDRDKLNNRIENLRLTTRSGNCHNIKASGIYFDKRRCNWYSCITTAGKQRRIGTFDNIIDARAAYLKEKRRINPLFK